MAKPPPSEAANVEADCPDFVRAVPAPEDALTDIF